MLNLHVFYKISYLPTMNCNTTKNVDVITEIFEKSRFWQIKNIIYVYLLKIPTAFFMACICYTAPIPESVEIYCNSTIDGNFTKMIYPTVIDVNDQEFNLPLCNVYSDIMEKTFIYLGKTNHTPLWIDPSDSDEELIPCTYFTQPSNFITNFDVFCFRGALVVLTQGMHLVGIFSSGIVVRYLTRV